MKATPGSELPQSYEPQAIEAHYQKFWETKHFYQSDPQAKGEKFVLVLPPPNVTGVLHMGHALTVTLEDILTRWHRMRGFNTLWVPGTDHAGIATQMVVERKLQKEKQVSRHQLGREKFLEEVWKWKDESQKTILGQLRIMGCSLDWSRLHFTLDPGVSAAVRECFVRFYDDGLIYRDTAITQWCPRCQTALSDLEVKAKDVQGSLWKIRYPAANGAGALIVATTRPETLFGDVAVAVNPDDARYTQWIGKHVKLPLTEREIPVIADSYVDVAFGTGALKITPGHDVNDYEVGRRHKLPVLTVFDGAAKLNELAGKYAGLPREKAREAALKDLEEQGLLAETTPHKHAVGHCDRCGTVVEPRVSQQWFVNAKELAEAPLAAVKKGEVKILPAEWEKNFFEWMENIRPWCISRQLWWGHRIPVWYCGDCNEAIVAVEAPTACTKCKSAKLRQDDDVLDTWFSSGLWPLTTLGWPNTEHPDFKAYYPNSILETGFDILFFWVARMLMMGTRLTGKAPFHTVYLHPMVRDEFGQKMSKTKGNVKDPLEIVDRLGADALRFTLAAMAVHGRDVLLSDSRIEGYRNFINKIWNATRFVMMHFGDVEKSHVDPKAPINQWIWAKLEATKQTVDQALKQYRFFDAANALYHFVWNDYCDWFIELVKVPEELERRKREKESTAVEVLEQALRLLHPLMPFATEALWQTLKVRPAGESISVAPYPEPTAKEKPKATELETVIAVVEAVRSRRGEAGLAPAVEITVAVQTSPALEKRLRAFQPTLARLVRAKSVTFGIPKDTAQVLVPISIGGDTVEVRIPRDELVDLASERERVEKEIAQAQAELGRAEAKLGSAEFTGKAPANVIQGVRDRKDVLERQIATLRTYAATLK